jgi:hypothetical protein
MPAKKATLIIMSIIATKRQKGIPSYSGTQAT